ncbi:MAG: DUF86 domain-containing protein, partial [Clostridia bacterium]|nr:DUF86 domain-containing protein [Clostridia bacterium]
MDVIINKAQTIERCTKRIQEEYGNNPENLNNFTKQDSIILNIQRACEACIDIAMYIISEKGWGIPQNSRDAFDILYQNHVIDDGFVLKLKSMVGFRNIAIHDYQAVNLVVVRKIIEEHLNDFQEFAQLAL